MTDLELWYDRPAESWNEALPVGNGRLGAMVFGGRELERLQLNDGTAWSGSLESEQAEPRVSAAQAADAIARSREAIGRGAYDESDDQLRRLQHRYTQSYLPFADLWLATTPTVSRDAGRSAFESPYRRSLDLASAEHVTRVANGPYTVTRRVVVSAPDDVLVMTIDTDDPEGLALRLTLESPLRFTAIARSAQDPDLAGLLLRLPSDVSPPVDEDEHPVTYSDDDGASMHGAVAVRWTHDGRAMPDGDGAVLAATGVRHAEILLRTRTTFVGIGQPARGTAASAFAEADATVRAAARVAIEELRERQRADHRRYFDRVTFEVDPVSPNESGPNESIAAQPIDERLRRGNQHPGGAVAYDPTLAALLFAYGRYLLISSSRPGGLPANLQGIWNDQLQAPWSGNYTTNINVEMNYWQAEVANLSELAEPFFELIDVLRVRGQETAERIYGAPGWVAHHNTDPWGYTQPVGRGRHEPRWAFWPLAGAWLVRHLWEHLLFGADDEFARTRAWPAIRSAAEFSLSWVVRTPDGTDGTFPSTSPENSFRAPDGQVASAATSSAMDLTLISDVFRMTVALAERLGLTDDPVARAAALRLVTIPGPSIGRDGGIAEWSGDFEQPEPHHRHLSHLYFAYPGDSPLTPELKAAVIASLDSRGDEATGWSLAWKIALRARMGQPDAVSRLLTLVFRDMTEDRGGWIGGLYPNMLVAHPPFQIDGNLGFVAGLIECLVQSHAGAIELLPALPAELGTGRIRGVIARPGLELDLEWADGDLVSARVATLRPGSRGIHMVSYRGSQVQIDLTNDESVALSPLDFASAQADAAR